MNRPVLILAALSVASLTACGAAFAAESDSPDLLGSSLGARTEENNSLNWPEAGIPADQFNQVVSRKEGMRRVISFLSNVDKELKRSDVSDDRAQRLREHAKALLDAACTWHDEIDDRYEDDNLQQWGSAHCQRQT